MAKQRPDEGNIEGDPFDAADFDINEFLSSPPSAPPGQNLLDANDRDQLQGFFGTLAEPSQLPYGDGLNFTENVDSWLGSRDLPPDFLGHSTHAGQIPQPNGYTFAGAAGVGSVPFLFQPNVPASLPVMPLSTQIPPQIPPQIASHMPTHMPHQIQHQVQHQIPPQIPSPFGGNRTPMEHEAIHRVAHRQPQQLHQPPTFTPSPLDHHQTQANVATALTSMQNSHQNGNFPHPHRNNNFSRPPSHQPRQSRQSHGASTQFGYATSPNRSSHIPRPTSSGQQYTGNLFASRPAESSDASLFTDMWLGSRPLSQRPAAPSPLGFGSDVHFSNAQGYQPPTRESSQAEMRQMQTLSAFQKIESAPGTRESSPVRNGGPYLNGSHASHNGFANGAPSAATPSKKRRPGGAQVPRREEEDDEEDESVMPPPRPRARKRKSNANLGHVTQTAEESPPDPPGKRRKSGTGDKPAKPPKENLTEEQKRNNHILSEKRRRRVIKDGYDDLQFLIPNIGNGQSKAVQLDAASKWVKNLINGNAELRFWSN
ncbi:hypothetical protein GGR57DRAFT_354041 [Xylariaceae sp. FL1272]|nr:hypothetical protein GGR57DRAFT_354041 [Xylariaceae sp. FL1272]